MVGRAPVTALSYDHGAETTPLIGITAGDLLRDVAREVPDLDAVVDVEAGTRLTYAELSHAADLVAHGLIASGIETGDRIALWSRNRLEWVVAEHGVARTGAILVNVNPAFGVEELHYLLSHAGVRLLIAEPELRGQDQRAVASEASSGLAHFERAVFFESPEWSVLAKVSASPDGARIAARAEEFDFDHPFNIQFTSGTTGSPKGATLSHHNLLNNALTGAKRMGITGGDRICTPVPLFHTFGTVYGTLACLVHRATLVLPAASFNPLSTLQAIEKERCTALYGVPTMFIAELDHPDRPGFDLSSLRTGLMAGAPCPVEITKRVIEEMGIADLGIGYGMTETSPCSVQTEIDDPPDLRVTSVGRVMPHTEIKIVDPTTNNVVPRGAKGELCTRGYLVMHRYWEDAERTEEAVDAARWMHTGDLAIMDDQGYVNIVGRIKDIVIRGGENIDVREIEEVLYQHQSVAEVHVIGIPDPRLGEELMAWVRLGPGATADAAELQDWVGSCLARYKIPRHIRFVRDFPMTTSGKVQKFKLRAQAVAEMGLADIDTA